MTDGLLGKCKECCKRDAMLARQKRLEYYKAFDRARGNEPHRVLARLKYAASERGKERGAAGAKVWAIRNPKKRAAHVVAGNALRNGRLVKAPCEVCGNPKVEAHHDDLMSVGCATPAT